MEGDDELLSLGKVKVLGAVRVFVGCRELLDLGIVDVRTVANGKDQLPKCDIAYSSKDALDSSVVGEEGNFKTTLLIEGVPQRAVFAWEYCMQTDAGTRRRRRRPTYRKIQVEDTLSKVQ